MITIKREDITSSIELDKNTLLLIVKDDNKDYLNQIQEKEKCLKIKTIEITCKNG